ncbi:MAG: transcription elongation factor GreA [Fimbriimonadaceae bacterium]|nr:transcription elongation factor GreA [Fimbriimonadaceae bacterium]
MAQDVLLSQSGYDKLVKELEFLKGPERQRIAENIREAKSHGDLRENAMYHEAKLNQTRLESRIAELERTLQRARIVEVDEAKAGTVQMGSTVKVKDLDLMDVFSFTLVGEYEADPDQDMISIQSPLGAAMVGHEAGDEVEVDAPAGLLQYRILDVRDPA